MESAILCKVIFQFGLNKDNHNYRMLSTQNGQGLCQVLCMHYSSDKHSNLRRGAGATVISMLQTKALSYIKVDVYMCALINLKNIRLNNWLEVTLEVSGRSETGLLASDTIAFTFCVGAVG